MVNNALSCKYQKKNTYWLPITYKQHQTGINDKSNINFVFKCQLKLQTKVHDASKYTDRVHYKNKPF